MTTPLILEPPVGRKQGAFSADGLSAEWQILWFNPNNTVSLPVFILDEIPAGLNYVDVQCVAEGSSSCTAVFNLTLNRIEVTGIVAADYQAPPDATPDQLANEIVITLVTDGVQADSQSYTNKAEACWDYNNNGSAVDDYANKQPCIPVIADVSNGGGGSTDPVAIPTLSYWFKLMTLLLLLLAGMSVLYGRRESR